MQLSWQTARQRRARKARRQKKAARPHMLRTQILIGVLIVSAVGLLITGVYYVTRTASLQIETVSVVGGVTIPGHEVSSVVDESLVGYYYRLIPRRFAPTYPEREITERILQIERIKNVQVATVGQQEVQVVFEEYVPTALWCETSTSTSCLFMDTTGYAFTEAPHLEGSAFVRFINNTSSPEKRVAGFTAEFITTNQDFIDMLQSELDLYVTHVQKIGDYDLEYTVAGGGRLKISQTQSLEKSLQNLESILTSVEFGHLTDGSFQYIDLRFGDKVFVNEVTEANRLATSTATST